MPPTHRGAGLIGKINLEMSFGHPSPQACLLRQMADSAKAGRGAGVREQRFQFLSSPKSVAVRLRVASTSFGSFEID